MYLNILAFDLDGTIAENDVVASETWSALQKAKQAGFIIILVTGRRLKDLLSLRPFKEICEAIVCENGATIFLSRNDSVLLPFGSLTPELINQLEASNIPLERGMAIAATWIPHDKTVLKILRQTGYPATIEYNKGAVMMLPPGASKGTGLLKVLNELGYSPHNVIAFGDGENDRSFFEQAELTVAVANATPSIQQIADIVLSKPNGIGVRTFIEDLLEGKVSPYQTRLKHQIYLGYEPKGKPIHLSSIDLLISV